MSDETPAGEPPDLRTTPAAEEPVPASAPPPDGKSGAGWIGVRAALILFGVAAGIELVTMLGVKYSSDPNGNVGLFLPVGMLIAVGGLVAAIVVTTRLPRESRTAFWAMGVVCIAATAVLWGVTCGMAGTFRIQ